MVLSVMVIANFVSGPGGGGGGGGGQSLDPLAHPLNMALVVCMTVKLP